MKKFKYIFSLLLIAGSFLITNFGFSQYVDSDVIEYFSGSSVVLSESGLLDKVGTPLFNWLGSLINFTIHFFPVLLLITFFWLLYGLFVGLFKDSKDKKNKSLDNK